MCVRSSSMKCSRLSCVVLAVAAQCAAGFLVTGNHGLMVPAFRHRESTSRAVVEAPSQRGGSDTLTMGAAGKKRKKVRRDQYGNHPWQGSFVLPSTTHCSINSHHLHISLVPGHVGTRCYAIMSMTTDCYVNTFMLHT